MGYGITPQNLYDTQSSSGGPLTVGSGLMGLLGGPLGVGVGAALSGIGGLLAGKTETEKLQEKLLRQRYEMGQKRGRYAGQLQGQLRNPGQFTQGIQQQMTPFLNRLLSQASQRVGTGSGVGQGEVLQQGQGMFAKLSSDNTSRLQSLIERLLG